MHCCHDNDDNNDVELNEHRMTLVIIYLLFNKEAYGITEQSLSRQNKSTDCKTITVAKHFMNTC